MAKRTKVMERIQADESSLEQELRAQITLLEEQVEILTSPSSTSEPAKKEEKPLLEVLADICQQLHNMDKKDNKKINHGLLTLEQVALRLLTEGFKEIGA